MEQSQSSARNYLIALIVTVIVLSGFVLVIVLLIDPLWLGQHENRLNRFQETYDERLTKTIRLTYGDRRGAYDAVLIGSSRASYLPADQFINYKVFNYAVSSLYPGEYMGMLDTFARLQGRPKAIIIGADFFSTRSDWENRIESYLNDAQSLSKVAEKIFSIDTLLRAYGVMLFNYKNAQPKIGSEVYDRKMRKAYYRNSNHTPYYRPMLSKYCRIVYGPSYAWNKSLPDQYGAVLANYRDARIIIYTSPITGALYDALIHSGRFDDYAHWLTLLVETYGEVLDLMGHNIFTDDPNNYYDYHHFSAEGGAWLIENVLEAKHPAIGARVTRDNLAWHLAHKRQEAELVLKTKANSCKEFL